MRTPGGSDWTLRDLDRLDHLRGQGLTRSQIRERFKAEGRPGFSNQRFRDANQAIITARRAAGYDDGPRRRAATQTIRVRDRPNPPRLTAPEGYGSPRYAAQITVTVDGRQYTFIERNDDPISQKFLASAARSRIDTLAYGDTDRAAKLGIDDAEEAAENAEWRLDTSWRIV